MGINAPTNKDLTPYNYAVSPGLNINKMCFGCSRSRLTTGGRVSKRTKMWYCVDCVPLKFKDGNAR